MTTPSRFGSTETAQSGARRIDVAVFSQRGEPLAETERRLVTLADRALRIFTSGTTGLPKAAEVSHRKLVVWSHWFAGLAGLTASDRLYNCLPMHHSVGGVVAVGAPLVFGGSVAIAERFSARRFWDDVARWECTAFQYIGELCRFLVAAPVRSDGEGRTAADRNRQRAFAGGVASRFSTGSDRSGSSNSTLRRKAMSGSTTSKARSARSDASRPISRCATRSRWRASTTISRSPVRGADGFCVRCADGEIGEALGRIGRRSGRAL